MSALSVYPDSVIATILQGWAAPVPVGVNATITAGESQTHQSIAVMTFSLAIPTLALLMRLYTKFILIKERHTEDWLLILSWILLCVYSAFCITSGFHGAGRHMWNIHLKDFYESLFFVNAAAITYCIVVGLIKVAILLQYLRIFVPSRDRKNALCWVIYIWIGLISVFYFILMFVAIFQCNPPAAYYNPYVKGQCLSWQASAEAVCIFTIISDFALWFIPMWPVYRLHLATKKKLFVAGLFGLGFIDCFASIMRTYYTWRVIMYTDISWNTSSLGIWSWIEIAFGILVACLPVSPRFIKHFHQKSSSFIRSRISGSPRTEPTNIEGSNRSKPMQESSRSKGNIYELTDYEKSLEALVFEEKSSKKSLGERSSAQTLAWEESPDIEKVTVIGKVPQTP